MNMNHIKISLLYPAPDPPGCLDSKTESRYGSVVANRGRRAPIRDEIWKHLGIIYRCQNVDKVTLLPEGIGQICNVAAHSSRDIPRIRAHNSNSTNRFLRLDRMRSHV